MLIAVVSIVISNERTVRYVQQRQQPQQHKNYVNLLLEGHRTRDWFYTLQTFMYSFYIIHNLIVE